MAVRYRALEAQASTYNGDDLQKQLEELRLEHKRLKVT